MNGANNVKKWQGCTPGGRYLRATIMGHAIEQAMYTLEMDSEPVAFGRLNLAHYFDGEILWTTIAETLEAVAKEARALAALHSSKHG